MLNYKVNIAESVLAMQKLHELIEI